MEKFRVIAPVRADLAGGTLDLWPLYCILGEGKTVNVALDLHAKVSFEILPAVVFCIEIEMPSGKKHFFEEPLEEMEIGKLSPELRFPVTIVSEYLRGQDELPEKLIRIAIQTEAPVGSGLGGSSTLCVALVRGLSRIFNHEGAEGWQWILLNWVKDLEAKFLKTATGTQDYLSAMFGGLSCFTSKIGRIDRQTYDPSVIAELSQRMIVLFSGQMHSSGLSNWEIYKKALDGDAQVLSGLKEIANVASGLDKELASGRPSWRRVGEYLSEEWEIRRRTFQVHTPRLDEIIVFLGKQNALGKKVCGAAQGGSLIALAEPEQREQLAEACRKSGMQVLETSPCEQGVAVVIE